MTAAGKATLQFKTFVGGTGALDIAAGGTVSALNGATAGETVGFLGKTGLLDLQNAAAFAGTIAGFTASDRIDLLKTKATSLAFGSGKLSVLNGGATVGRLAFTGSYTTSNFVLGSDGHGGSLITWKA
jgi:hypothetical protein